MAKFLERTNRWGSFTWYLRNVKRELALKWEAVRLRKREVKVKFFLIDDYTSPLSIWDDLLLKYMSHLPSKPRGWRVDGNRLPVGDWELHNGMFPLLVTQTYVDAGIPKPTREELPAIICIDNNGVVKRENNVTAKDAAKFIWLNL